jgi:hypothetical protein
VKNENVSTEKEIKSSPGIKNNIHFHNDVEEITNNHF